MKKRSRIASLFMAVVLAVTSVVPVCAYGSKQADVLTGEDEVDLEEGNVVSENIVPDAPYKKIVIEADDNIVSDAKIVVPTTSLVTELNKLATGTEKKITLPVAKQTGSKFKGYKVIINGKEKIVKKLTKKQYAKLGKDNDGNLIMSPVFTLLKFKVTIKKAPMPNGKKVKGRTYKNASYDQPVKLSVPSVGYKRTASANNCTFIGYKDQNGKEVGMNETIYAAPEGKKSVTLTPQFKANEAAK